MTNCECPMAGYCKRHGFRKPAGLYTLCKTRKDYFDLWEAGYGPGQAAQEPVMDRSARKKRVAEAVQRKKRLIGWLSFFRHESDRGIGDTAQRLIERAGTSPDAYAALHRLLKQCACRRRDAVAMLNSRHPYEAL